MTLTGKCKEDFINWIKNEKIDFVAINNCGKIIENALIIYFFDSVGIYISIEHNHKVGFMYILDECCDNGFKTRREATEQAFKKANEIYNEQTK